MSDILKIKRKNIEVLQDIKNDLLMSKDVKKRRISEENSYDPESLAQKKPLKYQKSLKSLENDLECIIQELLENQQENKDESQKWERPSFPLIDPTNDDICLYFFCLYIYIYIYI